MATLVVYNRDGSTGKRNTILSEPSPCRVRDIAFSLEVLFEIITFRM